VLIKIGDSVCKQAGVLRCPVQKISHHDHLVFKIAGEDLNLMAEISDPSVHARYILVCGLHIVPGAVGRDQKNRHSSLGETN
jgi:hypothetical protein